MACWKSSRTTECCNSQTVESCPHSYINHPVQCNDLRRIRRPHSCIWLRVHLDVVNTALGAAQMASSFTLCQCLAVLCRLWTTSKMTLVKSPVLRSPIYHLNGKGGICIPQKFWRMLRHYIMKTRLMTLSSISLLLLLFFVYRVASWCPFISQSLLCSKESLVSGQAAPSTAGTTAVFLLSTYSCISYFFLFLQECVRWAEAHLESTPCEWWNPRSSEPPSWICWSPPAARWKLQSTFERKMCISPVEYLYHFSWLLDV